MITNTANPPSTAVRGGFDDNAYEVVEKALSQSEGQSARQQSGSMSYGQSLRNLMRLQEDANTWTCPPLLINVAASSTSDDIIQIDIAETLLGREGGRNVPSPEKRNDDNCYWFAKIFNINTDEFREKEIVREIKAACRAAGFTVNCKYKKMEYGNGCIEVKCCRGTYHCEEKSLAHNRKKARSTKSNAAPKAIKKKTTKPVHGQDGNDTRCPFHFQIYWDEKHQRWFLPKIQRGNRVHCGHSPIDPADIKLETKNSISPEEEVIARDSLQSHISTAATQNLIRTRTGETLSWQQVYHMKKRQENAQYGGNENTACDRLLHYLTTTDGISCTFLFADPKTHLLSEKVKKDKRNSALTVEQLGKQLLGDDTDSPAIYAKGLKGRRELIHTETGELMLAVAFTTDNQRRKFDMFPEFVSGDDTEGTNSEKRSLYTLLGKDQNEKVFPIAWAFMPSKSQWAYDWFFGVAMPKLHPGDAIKRVEIVLTDADKQETMAVENNIGGNLKPSVAELRLFINALHRWCAWHRINRNFTQDSKYKPTLTRVKNSCVLSKIEVDVLERWLWYFIKNYETEEEVNFCRKLLDEYLNDEQQNLHIGEVDKADRQLMLEFITSSFQNHRHKLFESKFNCAHMGNVTTSASEAYHRGLKKAALGPTPGCDLCIAAKKIIDLANLREDEKSKKAAFDANATFGKADDRERTVQEFSTFCNDKLSTESESSDDYLQFRTAEDTFLVKCDYDKFDLDFDQELGTSIDQINSLFDNEDSAAKEEELDEAETKKLDRLKERLLGNCTSVTAEYRTMLRESMKYIIPRFERTRVVNLVQMPDGTWVLVCSCRLFNTRRYACRHVYRVLKRHPTLSDANVRWQNGYCQHYGRNDELTDAYMDLRSAELPGIIVTDEEVASIKSTTRVGSGDRDEDYFLRSYKKLYLRGSNTFWHENSERLRHILGDSICCVPVKPSSVASTALISKTSSTASHSQNGPTFGEKPSTSFGAAKMVHHSSTFAVPSQSRSDDCHNDSEMQIGNCDFVNNHPVDVDDSHKIDLATSFHPRYVDICNYAESAGDNGIAVMAKHFNHCQRRFLNFFNNSTISEDQVAAEKPPKSGSSPYVRFKHPFEVICRMAQRTGTAGIEVVSEELLVCQQELVSLVDGKKLSTKKSDSRRRKVTSPPGKSTRKRPGEWP